MPRDLNTPLTCLRHRGKLNEAQQRQVLSMMQSLTAEALKQHGLTNLEFASATKHFVLTSPKFAAKFEEDQQEQQQKMARLQGM